jgi:hypothetical protein
MRRFMNSTRKKISLGFQLGLGDPGFKRIPGLPDYLELNRPVRFLLQDNGP